jgi:hypothetical protein
MPMHRMLASIDFDDRFPFQAHEVHHEIEERMLSAKFAAVELSATQVLP